MTTEVSKDKEALRDLIDNYAILGDEKKIREQMQLFTPDATYKVYMNGILVANTSGIDTLEKEFHGHASLVKTYFTLNGQHTIKLDGNKATGISFSQIKMIREPEGKTTITDYSVKYDDTYIRQDGKWFIKDRIGYFMILEERPMN